MAGRQSNAVGYVATVHLDKDGQVQMPKSARRRLRLKAGSALTMLQMGRGVLLLPEQEKFEAVCERIRRTLLKTGRTKREILATLPEARKRVFKELYGELNDDEPS
jgi:AbrB family looped-hinge helix DNA binding protein